VAVVVLPVLELLLPREFLVMVVQVLVLTQPGSMLYLWGSAEHSLVVVAVEAN
jgi:hypothetical protein